MSFGSFGLCVNKHLVTFALLALAKVSTLSHVSDLTGTPWLTQPPCGSGKPVDSLNLYQVPYPAPDPGWSSHMPLLFIHCLPALTWSLENWKSKLDPISLLVHPDLPTYLYWSQVCANFSDFFDFLDVSEPFPQFQAKSLRFLSHSHLPAFFFSLQDKKDKASLLFLSYHILGFLAVVATSKRQSSFWKQPLR